MRDNSESVLPVFLFVRSLFLAQISSEFPALWDENSYLKSGLGRFSVSVFTPDLWLQL